MHAKGIKKQSEWWLNEPKKLITYIYWLQGKVVIHFDKAKDIHDNILAPMFLAEYDSAGKAKVKELMKLSKDEMWDLTERVIAYLLTEHGIVIADKEKYHIK